MNNNDNQNVSTPNTQSAPPKPDLSQPRLIQESKNPPKTSSGKNRP